MNREGVYWSHAFPSYILNAIPGSSLDQIYFSKPIMSVPLAYIFAKDRPPTVQKLYDNIGWLNSFGMVEFYKKMTKNGEGKRIFLGNSKLCKQNSQAFIKALVKPSKATLQWQAADDAGLP